MIPTSRGSIRTVRPEPVEGQSFTFSNEELGRTGSVSVDKALHFDKLSANGSFANHGIRSNFPSFHELPYWIRWQAVSVGALFLAALLLITGCATHGTRAQLPKLALAPVSFGGSLAQTQRLTFSPLRAPAPRKKKQDIAAIDALLEITPEALQLVGFMLNQQILKLHWDGETLSAEKSEKLPASVTPAQVLRDVQWVFWPNAAIQTALPSDWQIQTTAQQRELRQNGRLWLRIRYQTDAQYNGVIELENLAEGYRLHIEAATETGAQP